MKQRASAVFVLLAIASCAGVILLASSIGHAEPGPESGWWSSLYIQNTNATATPARITSASMRVYYVTPTGAPQVTSVPRAESYLAYKPFGATLDEVPGGFAIHLLPQDFKGLRQDGSFGAMPADNFEGTYLINSTQPVHTIADLTNRVIATDSYWYGISSGMAVGQYQLLAFSAEASALYFPVVKYNQGTNHWNYKTSTLFLQNTSATASGVHVDYRCAYSTTGCTLNTVCETTTAEIQPWASILLDTSILPENQVCSAAVYALVEAPYPVGPYSWSGLYTEHFVKESSTPAATPPATLLQSARALTDDDASTTLYAPVFKKNYSDDGAHNRTTGFYVMNTGGSTSTVTGHFYGVSGCSGDLGDSPVQVEGLATRTLSFPANMPDGCRGAARFEVPSGAGPIVGMVVESFPTWPATLPGTQSATVYAMLPSQAATAQVMFPIFKEKVAEYAWYRSTELTIQNTSSSNSTEVYAVFKGIDGTQGGPYTTNHQLIPANGSFVLRLASGQPSGFWNGTAMPTTGGSFAVTVYSVSPGPGGSAQNILAIAREESYYRDFESGDYRYCYGQNMGYACPDRADYEGFNIP